MLNLQNLQQVIAASKQAAAVKSQDPGRIEAGVKAVSRKQEFSDNHQVFHMVGEDDPTFRNVVLGNNSVETRQQQLVEPNLSSPVHLDMEEAEREILENFKKDLLHEDLNKIKTDFAGDTFS